MKKRTIAILLCASLILTILTGCGSGKDTADSGSSSASSGSEQTTSADSSNKEGKYKDTVSVAFNSNLNNPSYYASTSRATRTLASMIYSSIVRQDRQSNEVVPDLAYEWSDVSENKDCTLWEFKLNEGVKFHNGSDFTASDAVFTWNLANDTVKTTNIQRITAVEEFIAVDDYTLHIKCSVPEADIPNYLANLLIVDEQTVEEMGFDEGTVIGTGAYYFEAFTDGVEFSVVRFDDYFGEPAKTRRIVVKDIVENTTRLIALQTGEVDAIFDLGATDVDSVANDPNLTLTQRLAVNVRHFGLNCNIPILEDVRVRQAIAYAIDRDAIVQIAYNGNAAEATYNFFGDELAGTQEIDGLEYNPEKSKQLLKEAGYADGFEMELVHYQGLDQIAACIQANLAEVGITAVINKIDSTVNRETLMKGTFGGFINYCVPNVDATFANYQKYFTEGGAMNYAKYQDDEFDSLLAKGSTSADQKERDDIALELQQKIVDDAVFVPLAAPYLYAAYQNNVQGVVLSNNIMLTDYSSIYVIEE